MLITSIFVIKNFKTNNFTNFRSTFFICFLGFTQTVLFDERRNPYHLMIRDFVNADGIDAFFRAFEWVTQDEKTLESYELPAGHVDFLDSWLSLLDKMVNPYSILETPHVMAPKSNANLGYVPFDPIKYLIDLHKRAFSSLVFLWDRHSKKCYGDQMSQHILSVLRHLFESESIINEHLKKEAENQAVSASKTAPQALVTTGDISDQRTEPIPTVSTTEAVPNVNVGPTVGIEVNPVNHQESNNIEIAGVSNFTFNQLVEMGFDRTSVQDALSQCQTVEQATEYLLTLVPRNQESNPTAQEVDMASEDSDPNIKPETSLETDEGPLFKRNIDKFTENLLPGVLRLMDELPDTVYEVCDLILTISLRNGEDWCKNLLIKLLEDINQNVESLLEMTEPLRSDDKRSFKDWTQQMKTAPEANRVSVRVHLYSLIFNELKIRCADLLHQCGVINNLVTLLERALSMFTLSRNHDKQDSIDGTNLMPKWLTPTILLIDLYENGALASQLRAPLITNMDRTWQYFEERTGKWTRHPQSNNKIIDSAYKKGKQHARYSVGRKHYVAQFHTMLQINEETKSYRPIMMTVSPSKDIHFQDVLPIVPRLEEHQCKTLIRVCVGFMKLAIDANSLQAVLQLSFRLTRDHNLAVLFAESDGVKAIQQLHESCSFTGYPILATMIIRHVLEEPSVLLQTMEKVIRTTTQHSQSNSREMHCVLRALGPAIFRNEEAFKKLATELLRIAPYAGRRDDEDNTATKPDAPQILKTLPPKQTPKLLKPSPISKLVITSLLDSLTYSVKFNHDSNTNIIDDNVRIEQTTSDNPKKQSMSEESHSKPSPPKSVNLLMNHSVVLRLLAELTRSYSFVPKIIAEHYFTPATNIAITEKVSALAFILDNILPVTQTHSDKDGPNIARIFLASLSASNHCVEAQTAVVNEVKASFNRAAGMPESCDKHARLQSLATMIGTMIEACPSVSPQQVNSHQNNNLPQQRLSNNIVRLFVRKGLVTDLAKTSLSLDVSAPHMAQTINAVLKPFETLSRFVNLPSQFNVSRSQNNKSKNESIDESNQVPLASSFSSSSSSSSIREARVNEEVGAVDEREEVGRLDEREDDREEESGVDEEDEDDEDDEEDDDEDDDHVEDEDPIDGDYEDELFHESQIDDDYRYPHMHLNGVFHDFEDVFLQNQIYPNRINNILPGMIDGLADAHESATPSLPPPPHSITINHPLLRRRRLDPSTTASLSLAVQPPNGLINTRTQRYTRPRSLRGASGNSPFSSRHPPQTILQHLLGPNHFQEVISLTSQLVGPRFLLTDFNNWLSNEEEFFDHAAINSNQSSLNSIPTVMTRWTEAARILDSTSMYDCVTHVKNEIIPILEKYRDEEILEKQEKKKKLNEQKTRPDDTEPEGQKSTTEVEQPQLEVDPQLNEAVVELLQQHLDNQQPQPDLQANQANENQDIQPEDQQNQMQDSQSSQIEIQEQENELELNLPDEQVGQPETIQQHIDNPPTHTASDPATRESEIPEGVDPSFLAALPEDIRQEVIAEQRRLRRSEQTNSQPQDRPASGPSTSFGLSEVNPEFLAALPADVQEEVLAQQRAQQRQAALNSNPDQPVDAASFIQTLAPNLRRQVLADIDDSLLPVLPSELAAEAQALRRELISSHQSANSTLSRLLRNAASGRMQRTRYPISSAPDHTHPHTSWNWTMDRTNGSLSQAGMMNRNLLSIPKDFKGRQLLDCEALSCLVILLFVDEPALNITRLHRVLRNLSYHHLTRQWIVQSILSIIDRSKTSEDGQRSATLTLRSSKKNLPRDLDIKANSSSWLSISMDAALGCRTSVFSIQRTSSVTQSKHISIHPQAAPSICLHMLEALITLAKSFPQHFFPDAMQSKEETPDNESSNLNKSVDFWEILAKMDSSSANVAKKSRTSTKSGSSSVSATGALSITSETDKNSPLAILMGFLDHPVIKRSFQLTDRLLHLLAVISTAFPSANGHNDVLMFGNQQQRNTPVGRYRSSTSTHSTHIYSISRPTYVGNRPVYPVNSGGHPIAHYVTARPVHTEESNNTKPLTTNQTVDQKTKSTSLKDKQALVSKPYLKLAVDVLTSKSCSEEGLDDVTALLSRLSRVCEATRITVLELLVDGARQLGTTVCHHILTLKQELIEYNQKIRLKASTSTFVSSAQIDTLSPNPKGVLQDRFTSDSVVITAPTNSKAGREVQLPSMATLTSKNSSQAFFLRILRVIIVLKDSKLLAKSIQPTEAEISGRIQPRRQFAIRTGGLPTPHLSIHDLSRSSPLRLMAESGQPEQQQNVPQQAAPEPQGSSSDAPAAMEVDMAADPEASATDNQIDDLPKADEMSSVIETTAQPAPEESLSIELSLDELWASLSDCLLELAETPDHHAVLVLQPAVEAFFLVHSPGQSQNARLRSNDNHNTDKTSQTAHIDQDLAPISPSEKPITELQGGSGVGNLGTNNTGNCLSYGTQKFLKFAETHRVVLNHILRQSTTPLSRGPFAVLVDHTRILDFDVKRRYFRQELERMDEGVRRDDLGIHVRRDNVFEESFRELHRRGAEDWKNRFFVVFQDEEGQDAGGLLREWYTIISREIFNPMYALFTTSPGDRVTYMINSSSHCNTNHLTYFKFVGRVIAKAIYDNKLLDCYFTRSFYKHILGKPVKYTDMESEDYSFYQGLVFLLENDVSELGYELTFSVEVREFGVTEARELKPNGANIPVTEENKHEYVRLVCQEKMTGSIRKQLSAFLEGFYDIIPKRLISIFNEQELELLISGLPTIDIDDLKNSTEYHKYLPNSLQIQWFWRALRSFDQADRAKLLQFVTGTSKVPLQGFASLEGMNGVQKFQIHRDERSTDRLPSAHTCFNQLDLPVYETYDKLRYMLLKAIQECSEGFGLA